VESNADVRALTRVVVAYGTGKNAIPDEHVGRDDADGLVVVEVLAGRAHRHDPGGSRLGLWASSAMRIPLSPVGMRPRRGCANYCTSRNPN
jgi:hypothetical protein